MVWLKFQKWEAVVGRTRGKPKTTATLLHGETGGPAQRPCSDQSRTAKQLHAATEITFV